MSPRISRRKATAFCEALLRVRAHTSHAPTPLWSMRWGSDMWAWLISRWRRLIRRAPTPAPTPTHVSAPAPTSAPTPTYVSAPVPSSAPTPTHVSAFSPPPPRWEWAPPPPRYPPEIHARELLIWLQEQGMSGCVTYRQIRAQHRRMVIAKGWAPRAWNPIARELTKLLGGKKTYWRSIDQNNRERRWRVFYIPSRLSSAPVPTMPGRDAQ